MISLLATIRESFGAKNKTLREAGKIPGVLYGSETKTISLEMEEKVFNPVYREAGESTLIELRVGNNSYTVLIHEIQVDPIKGNITHVDFFQPSLREEMEAEITLVFIGESLAVQDLGGTLIKSFSEITVKCLPENLPSHIDVDISVLNALDDSILVKDLRVPKDVKIQSNMEDVIVSVSAQKEIEEDLEKPIEDDVEEVEKVGEDKDIGKEKEVKEEEKEKEKKEEN